MSGAKPGAVATTATESFGPRPSRAFTKYVVAVAPFANGISRVPAPTAVPLLANNTFDESATFRVSVTPPCCPTGSGKLKSACWRPRPTIGAAKVILGCALTVTLSVSGVTPALAAAASLAVQGSVATPAYPIGSTRLGDPAGIVPVPPATQVGLVLVRVSATPPAGAAIGKPPLWS